MGFQTMKRTKSPNQDGSVTVIFRADGPKSDPSITAVFPCEVADVQGRYMSCYAHIGQHSGCGMEWYRATRPATPEQYADLLEELRHYGSGQDRPYSNLRIAQRVTPEMREVFNSRARELSASIAAHA